jgi:hypothetical protein
MHINCEHTPLICTWAKSKKKLGTKIQIQQLQKSGTKITQIQEQNFKKSGNKYLETKISKIREQKLQKSGKQNFKNLGTKVTKIRNKITKI